LVARRAAAHAAGGTLAERLESLEGSVGGARVDARPAELPALTSLRGMAAVAVVLFHSSFVTLHYGGGGPPWIWRRGYLAVDLFFFLSGFVLAHVYGHRLADDRGLRAVGKFLWARFCRVYPASLFVVSIFVLQYATNRLAFPPAVSFKAQLTASLLLMQVPWLNEVVINGPSWSISAEWYAYLLFPVIVPIILRLQSRMAALVCMSLLILIGIDHMIFTHEQQNFGWGALVRAALEFTVGIFAYRSYQEHLLRKIWEKDATLIVIGILMITLCLVGVSDGLVVIMMPFLLLASVCNSGRMAVILNARPLHWLGEVSYSVYIFQILPIMVVTTMSGILVAQGLRGIPFEVITALFAIGSGVLVHRCVDVPTRAALRRLPERLSAFAASYQRRHAGSVAATSPSVSAPRSDV